MAENYDVSVQFNVVGNFEKRVDAMIAQVDRLKAAVAGVSNISIAGKIGGGGQADPQKKWLVDQKKMFAEAEAAHAKYMSTLTTAAGGVGEIGSRLGGMIGDGISSAIGAVEKIAMVAGGALMAGAIYGVKNLNGELENTKIGIAGIFNANGVGNTFNESLEASSALIIRMRKDAARLPGTFTELATVFKSAAIPGLNAGMSPKEIEALSAQAMAVGKTALGGMNAETMGRQLAGLLSGHAGRNNTTGRQLFNLQGDTAAAFNKLSGDKRAEYLREHYKKYDPMLEVGSRSFEGVSSTALDNIKEFGRDSTNGLFESVKTALQYFNHWMDDNGGKWHTWAEKLGKILKDTFDGALSVFMKLSPLLEKALDKVTALSAPKLSTLATGAAGLASAGPIFEGFKIAQQMNGMVGKVAGTAIGGAGGGAAGDAIGQIVGFIPDILLFGGAWIAVMGAVHALTDSMSYWHSTMVWLTGVVTDGFQRIMYAANDLVVMLTPVAEFLGVFLVGAIAGFVQALAFMLENIVGTMNAIRHLFGGKDALLFKDGKKSSLINSDFIGPTLDKKGVVTPSVTNHHTTINKVEITVASNQDPSRIARLTRQELLNVSRNANYSRTGQVPYLGGTNR